MRSPRLAAQAEWKGARVTTPPGSSTEKHGSGGFAETTWNTAQSSSRSSLAKRGSARTWGRRSMPTTSTLESGWVLKSNAYVQHTKPLIPHSLIYGFYKLGCSFNCQLHLTLKTLGFSRLVSKFQVRQHPLQPFHLVFASMFWPGWVRQCSKETTWLWDHWSQVFSGMIKLAVRANRKLKVSCRRERL